MSTLSAFTIPRSPISTSRPARTNRENSRRRVVVIANVRGRALGFIAEAQERMKAVEIPTGYWLTWGGTFEQLLSALKRLEIVVPLSLLFILMMLFTALGNVKDALLTLFDPITSHRPTTA